MYQEHSYNEQYLVQYQHIAPMCKSLLSIPFKTFNECKKGSGLTPQGAETDEYGAMTE
jgi:hypothetical protein